MKLKAALAEQHRWGGRLGKILVDMNYVSEELLVKALSKQLGVPRADLSQILVPQHVLAQISADFAEQNGLCPVAYDESRRILIVATSDPTNVTALDELRFQTGLRIETALAGDGEIHAAIGRYLRHTSHGMEFEAIELDEDVGPAIEPDEVYARAMAASGLEVDRGSQAGRGVQTPPRATPPSPAPPPWDGTNLVIATPVAGPRMRPAPAPGPVPPLEHPEGHPSTGPLGTSLAHGPAGRRSLEPETPGSALEMATRLEGAQRQQQRALRVMVDLLIEKGVISRDEYMARVTKR
ncbi:MAG: hypothetical protein KC933_38410 [Myxococcales bacterium]|nr:hypothetical protein [Myxococcales bacterium]MCB9646812.1 hypothetical protein [Deltaproteobacteria bacterium]